MMPEPPGQGVHTGLLGNPFAILGATPRTPVADLFDLAETAEATAAARVLSVPRSRLGAELSFLPGASDAIPAILDALRSGRRVDPAGLPPLAAANLRAHLCATGLASPDDVVRLAHDMPAAADAALIAAIDADRNVAGVPPCQPGTLPAEIEALTDAHATALVDAVAATPDPAGRLSDLFPGAPERLPPLLRRAAAAWTRRSATDLSALEQAAAAAVDAWRARPGRDSLDRLEDAVRRWAALSRPQRLADKHAALDHPPTVRAIRPWRASAGYVAKDHPDAALPVLRLFLELFNEMPGEAASLAADVRNAAGQTEAQALAPLLSRLNELIARLTADPAPLRAQLATRPFGPAARKDAAALWAAFDAAASASAVSERAWAAVVPLAALLDIPHRPGGSAAAAALFTGLIARATADGRTALAAELRARLRAHHARAALDLYARRTGKRWIPWWLAPLRRRSVLAAIDGALAAVDDPAERRKLETHRTALRGGRRLFWVTAALLTILSGLAFGVSQLDEDYAANAPFRHNPPISLAAVPAPAPVPAPPPRVPPSPRPGDGASPAPATDEAHPVRTFSFPVTAGEDMPGRGTRALKRADVRWCLANAARLQAAEDIAMPDDEPGLDLLRDELLSRCNDKSVRQLDEDAVRADVARKKDRLRFEGEAMMGTPNR